MKETTEKARKLALSAETLRALGGAELRQVAGGFSDEMARG
jgi:hypothetical protein